MVNTQKTLCLKFPAVTNLPIIIKKPMFAVAKKLVYENEINSFLKSHAYMGPFEFIDTVLDYFDFSYKFSSNQIENIPPSGRVIIIANHPLGALDALSLIRLIKQVRNDVKVIANDILGQIKQLEPILLSIDSFGNKISKTTIENIYNSLDKEEVVVIFPSGEVSRARPNGVKDTKWHKGFLKFALKKNTPILPIYIKAKNSPIFYTISSINKKLSATLLLYEMFYKKGKSLEFIIGEIIPYKSFAKDSLDTKTKVKLFKKHLYSIAKNKKPIFSTQKCIAHPESRQEIKNELKNSELLGNTNDGKKIFLFEYKSESSAIKEISRLREFTFRKVEEGAGKKRDTDEFDKYYKHIILWDDDALEIVGSYRIGESDFIYNYYNCEGFYSNTLFDFTEKFKPYLLNSIELGRSFVQPRYWGGRALDYLWQGIGAYLAKNRHIRNMFGPVSLSSSLPKGEQ
ncbi:MAG: lysophospholipid acyltransferase family protein, partial [Campylobacteraceae bacterium]|nr:lysophospholipid acyltransferase family protein [Campylobacteraceae bacterium]